MQQEFYIQQKFNFSSTIQHSMKKKSVFNDQIQHLIENPNFMENQIF